MAEEEKKSPRKKKNAVPEDQYNDTLDKNLDIPPESLEESAVEEVPTEEMQVEEPTEEEHIEEPVEEEPEEEPEEEHIEEEPIEEEPEEEVENEEEALEEEMPEEQTGEDSSTPQYDQLKQELLQEYADQKSGTQEDDQFQATQDDSIDDNSEFETDMNQDTAVNHDDEQSESQPKYDFDDDLEIENVNENPEDNIDNQPKPLSSAQKEIAPDVDQGLSKVAISKGSSLAIMVGLILLLAFIIYKVMQPSAEELATITKSEIDNKLPVAKPIEDSGQTIVVPEIPKLPEAPVLSAPIPVAAPAPPPPPVMDMAAPSTTSQATQPPATPKTGVIGLPGIDVKPKDANAAAKDAADAARKKARITSSMMAGGSGSSGANKKGVSSDGKSLSILERNTDQVVATHIGELQRVIAQGKVIDAVLETAINTDLPGMIRAIVSQDVYSEAGKNILIPRGSRLVGIYSSAVKYGQNRVQIVWERIIRPDGVDIKVSSPGADDLGRSGTAGEVDNHIIRTFATAIMTSMIDISLAKYADDHAPSSGTTTTTVSQPNDSTQAQTTTTSGDVQTQESQAFDSAVAKMGAIGQDLMQKNMNIPTTITVDQGTTLKVFVKRDLVFPGRSANLTRLIE